MPAVDSTMLSHLTNPTVLGNAFEPAAESLSVDATQAALIRDAMDLSFAAEWRRRLAARRAEVVAFFEPIKSAAYKLHRAICDRESHILVLFDEPDARVAQAMRLYKTEQDRLRGLEEQRLADEARQAEQARLLREAAAIEATEPAVAAAVVEEALTLPAPTIVLPDTTREVVKFREAWKWRYARNSKTHAMTLLPREYLQPNEVAIGATVRAQKGLTKIPGIEVYKEDIPLR